MRRQVFKISIGQILLILILIIALVSVVSTVNGDKEENNIETKQTQNEVMENKDEANKSTSDIVEDTNFEDNTLAHGDFFSTFEDDENLLKEELSEDELLYITNVTESGDDLYILTGTLYKEYTYTASEIRYAEGRGYVTIYGKKYNMYESDVENEYDLYEEGQEELVYKIKPKTTSTYYLEAQIELADCWKLQDETYRVKASKNIKVENAYGDTYTVEEVFGNMENGYPEESTHPFTDRTFKFEFENGECIKVIDVLTSI